MSILKIFTLKKSSIKPIKAKDAINKTKPMIALVNLFLADSSDPLSPPDRTQETAPQISWKKKKIEPATNNKPTPFGIIFSKNASALLDSYPLRLDPTTGFVKFCANCFSIYFIIRVLNKVPKFNMFGIPIKFPTSLTISSPKTETVIPIIPLVIFFFADSIDPLSPLEVIIAIAPDIKINTNQIIPITVIRPIADDIKVAKIDGASVVDPARPNVPKPV